MGERYTCIILCVYTHAQDILYYIHIHTNIRYDVTELLLLKKPFKCIFCIHICIYILPIFIMDLFITLYKYTVMENEAFFSTATVRYTVTNKNILK